MGVFLQLLSNIFLGLFSKWLERKDLKENERLKRLLAEARRARKATAYKGRRHLDPDVIDDSLCNGKKQAKRVKRVQRRNKKKK